MIEWATEHYILFFILAVISLLVVDGIVANICRTMIYAISLERKETE